MKAKRTSNIELLRIIAIFMIICFHYSIKGEFSFELRSFNEYVLRVFGIFGELGVDIFMLITGYFMINGKFNWKKIALIISASVFYSLLANFVLCCNGTRNFSDLWRWKEAIFPDIYKKYWFVAAYMIVYLLSPYLNFFIKAMEKAMFKRFLTLTITIWCVIPVLFWINFGTTENILFYNRFIWFIIMYCVGSFIRLYGLGKLDCIKNNGIVSAISFLLMFVCIVIMENNPDLFANILARERVIWPPNTLLMLALSVSIFNIFRLMEIKYNRIINLVGGSTLGIYIFHDSGLNPLIWGAMRDNVATGYLILDLLFGAVIMFCMAFAAETARRFIEKYTLSKILDMVDNAIQTKRSKKTLDKSNL